VNQDGTAKKENTPEEIREYVKQDYQRMESLVLAIGHTSAFVLKRNRLTPIHAITILKKITPVSLGIESDLGTITCNNHPKKN